MSHPCKLLAGSHFPVYQNYSASLDTSKSENGLITKSGGSIADRMRSLQDAGLTVSTTKRFLNSNLPTPPKSPEIDRHNRNASFGLPSPPNQSTILAPVTPISSTPSPHAFVSPSTLGPPSPTSSPSSSPQISHYGLSEFSQAFPPIDELDESDRVKYPQDVLTKSEMTSTTESRPFPVLPIDPGPRPSSTPITPTINTFISRPGTPAPTHAIQQKPSNLGPGRTPPPPSPDRPQLPVSNVVAPKALHEYTHHGSTVLFLDVRNREEFDKEHIKADAVVCLEPSVLMREKSVHLANEEVLI
jgi:ubiquitin carboxyl-terminal hydrolase 8